VAYAGFLGTIYSYTSSEGVKDSYIRNVYIIFKMNRTYITYKVLGRKIEDDL